MSGHEVGAVHTGGSKLIPEVVVDRLRCPECGKKVEGDLGGITCRDGHRFETDRGYLDCSKGGPGPGSTERTLASFGYEWTNFDEVREEDEAFAAVYFRDLDLESLHGKVGLDAGCGKGRYTRFLAPHLAAMVALDGSAAVQSATRNLADIASVLVVKSDLREAPFAPSSFDLITSLGVLHHLDDPRAGFERLLDLLAPGGRILVYLYSRPSTPGLRATGLRLATALRTVTVRLPHRTLKVLSAPIAAALYFGLVVPGEIGERHKVSALSGLPMQAYRGQPLRSLFLDTFDRLSAPVENRYVWSDLAPWFEDAGLVVDAARDETGWFVLAHRP